MAVKKTVKKSVKKVATKKIVKKAVLKTPVKKAVIKTPVKKTIKKAVVKTPVKKIVKKAVVKTPVKKIVKKAVVKTPVKKIVKKAVVKTPVKKIIKKAVVKAPVKKIIKKAVVKAPEKKIIKKAVMKTPVKKIVKKAVSKAPIKKTVKKAVAKTPIKKIVKKAVVKTPIKKTVKNTVVKTPAKKTTSFKTPIEQGRDLPKKYDVDKLVILPKNSDWLFCYWSISKAKKQAAIRDLGQELFNSSKLLIKVHDITGIDRNIQTSNNTIELEIFENARSWYIPISLIGKDLIAEVGYKSINGNYYKLSESNTLFASIDNNVHSSNLNKELINAEAERLTSAEKELLDLSAGMELDIEVDDNISKVAFTQALDLSSGKILKEKNLSSFVFNSSWQLPSKKEEKSTDKNRDFWLNVETDLILYGSTLPDANVSVMGKKINLNADGTFSIYMKLPDGIHELEVNAKSADGIDEEIIIPVVKKDTF